MLIYPSINSMVISLTPRSQDPKTFRFRWWTGHLSRSMVRADPTWLAAHGGWNPAGFTGGFFWSWDDGMITESIQMLVIDVIGWFHLKDLRLFLVMFYSPSGEFTLGVYGIVMECCLLFLGPFQQIQVFSNLILDTLKRRKHGLGLRFFWGWTGQQQVQTLLQRHDIRWSILVPNLPYVVGVNPAFLDKSMYSHIVSSHWSPIWYAARYAHQIFAFAFPLPIRNIMFHPIRETRVPTPSKSPKQLVKVLKI